MVNVNELWPSRWLSAADISDIRGILIINFVNVEEVGHDKKPVMYFNHQPKGLIINKTNSKTVANAYGPDTDDWTGGAIKLVQVMVDVHGEMRPSIRIVIPKARVKPQPAPSLTELIDDDIPYNE